MFGYIRANIEDLTEEEKIRYRTVYCGLCKKLQKKYGLAARLSLSYDLTFLILLLSSLYEPDEETYVENCIVHPLKKSTKTVNDFSDYAADLTIALAYHNCIDDWKDDKNYLKKLYAGILKSDYNKVKTKLSKQCETIERELETLSEIENSKGQADEAANSFGRLMGALFVTKKDKWAADLYSIGFNMGRFIYMADATVDYEDDIKSNSYNPLIILDKKPEDMRPVLTQILGQVSESFERLPLDNDINLLRNILYSGVWLKINESKSADREELTNDR